MKIKVEIRELYKFNKEHTEDILWFAKTKYDEICDKYYKNANILKRFMVAFKFPLTPAMFHSGEYLIGNEEDLRYATYLRTLYFRAKGLKTICKYIPNTSHTVWLDEFETDCYCFCVDFIGEDSER